MGQQDPRTCKHLRSQRALGTLMVKNLDGELAQGKVERCQACGSHRCKRRSGGGKVYAFGPWVAPGQSPIPKPQGDVRRPDPSTLPRPDFGPGAAPTTNE